MLDRTKTPLEDRVYLLDEAALILEVYIIQTSKLDYELLMK